MLLLAAVVAALIVPVGFALSLDSAPIRTARVRRLPTAAVPSTAVAVTSSVARSTPSAQPVAGRALTVPVVPDVAKLLLVGTVLFGLAAFVRKAI